MKEDSGPVPIAPADLYVLFRSGSNADGFSSSSFTSIRSIAPLHLNQNSGISPGEQASDWPSTNMESYLFEQRNRLMAVMRHGKKV